MTIYQAMTTELLENVKESLEKLEGLVKPDDKQLRTLAIQAIEHCQSALRFSALLSVS